LAHPAIAESAAEGINPALLEYWKSAARRTAGTDAAAHYRVVRRGHERRIAVLRALREAGAPVLVGTDTPNPYVPYGSSAHDEMGFFQDAGYSAVDVLRIATLDAARFLGADRDFGTIAP